MRVLILTSSTGGGHNMRARAFQEWAQAEPALDISAQIHRPLENSHSIYAFRVWLYNWIQRTAPFLHHAYFNFLEVVPVVRSGKPLGAARYRRVLEELQPDMLLSVHDSLNHGFFEYARVVLGEDRVKCVTYCGELSGGYGFSRHWVNPSADLFIGAVPETCDAAVRWGMPPERTQVGGFLLRRFFYDETADDAGRVAFIREQLRFDPDEFILLLSASSRGAHNHVRFLEALKRRGIDLQVVLLCGKSQITESEVSEWAKANPRARVRLLPHNTNVGQLMRSVSAIVARPGTGTTSEAIVSGCPLLLNCLGGIMPQERITVKFCRDLGVAQLVRSPEQLADIVGGWKNRPELPASIRAAMKSACPPLHPSDILRTVASLCVRDMRIDELRISAARDIAEWRASAAEARTRGDFESFPDLAMPQDKSQTVGLRGSNDAKPIIGVLNPTNLTPSFAIPVFGSLQDAYVQETDASRRILRFRPVTLPECSFTRIQYSKTVTIGDAQLFGFCFSETECTVGTEAELRYRLYWRVSEFAERPFLLIDIARFLQSESILTEAISAASARLRTQSPEPVETWLEAIRTSRRQSTLYLAPSSTVVTE